ncbi:tetratricopeptide repeat protein [Rhizobium leguminosarum]|uniref:FxSxx-COOH system tetratricopeptide repeat protein n=1 Tax=Rhizobium leguminosarum TaxID=384 RepID=UPI001C979498|nr:FxSxx-COOH system tetratricopeptide repeat protein [Rhizobium leguminosarum]MBY5904149.1 tetratricopeptide repeat protein [Rhizobium leguminosarum]MBY5912764.1 tetratricopeptide repeat protein [Rhizobium leguminosarum]
MTNASDFETANVHISPFAEAGKLVALFGARGVGKTTLAVAYAERQSHHLRATWWVRAESEESMKSDIVSLGLQLGWVPAREDEEAALSKVLERLCVEGNDILLIYDSATTSGSIRPFLPRTGAAKILVTSNSHAWRSVGQPYEIKAWAAQTGCEYLIGRTGYFGQSDEALNLSERLGGLPLALEQAGAFCERLEISFSEYLFRFDASPITLLDDERHAPFDYRNRLTVAKTFAMAIGEVAKMHPAAEPLIVYAALMAPDPIPIFYFSEGSYCLQPLGEMLEGNGLEEAIASLRSFALIDREQIVDERNPDVRIEAVRLHRLVRDVAMNRWSERELVSVRAALRAAMGYMLKQFDPREFENWPIYRALLSHADICATVDEHSTQIGEALTADILYKLATYRYLALAAYSPAIRDIDRTLELYRHQLGPDHFLSTGPLSALASIFHSQGKLHDARLAFERVLAIAEKNPGIADLIHTKTLNGLGLVLLDQGELTKARSTLELALSRSQLYEGHPRDPTCSILNNLGLVLKEQGHYEEALPVFEKAVALNREINASGHPDFAKNINNLALVFEEVDRLDEARELFEEALAINLKFFGADHPDTAMSLTNLAGLQGSLGNHVEAQALHQQALDIRKRLLNPEHPYIGLSLKGLGLALLEQGKLEEAGEMLDRAIFLRDKIDPNHPAIASTLTNLAGVRMGQGKYEEARTLLERAFTVRKRALGSDHPSTKRSAEALTIFDDD